MSEENTPNQTDRATAEPSDEAIALATQTLRPAQSKGEMARDLVQAHLESTVLDALGRVQAQRRADAQEIDRYMGMRMWFAARSTEHAESQERAWERGRAIMCERETARACRERSAAWWSARRAGQ